MIDKPSCQSCKHKIEVETTAEVFVSLYTQCCTKFVRENYDPVKGSQTRALPCEYAMKTFCGLGDWEPNFWTRVKRWWND